MPRSQGCNPQTRRPEPGRRGGFEWLSADWKLRTKKRRTVSRAAFFA